MVLLKPAPRRSGLAALPTVTLRARSTWRTRREFDDVLASSPAIVLGPRCTLHANYLRRVAHHHRDDGITYHWAVLHHPRPDRAIVDHVADRGGIALTTHGAGGQLGGLGPVAARVLRRARGPVIVAPAMSQP